MTARGEGFVSTEFGLQASGEKYGRPELSMTVKGQEFPAYDPRGIQGMGLATQRQTEVHVTFVVTVLLKSSVCQRRRISLPDGKAGQLRRDATALVDSSGLCVFTTFAWSMDDIAPQVNGACGATGPSIGAWKWVTHLEYGRDQHACWPDDGRRHVAEALVERRCATGPAQGKVNELDKMLPEYYEARGWTADGEITTQTRQRLSL